MNSGTDLPLAVFSYWLTFLSGGGGLLPIRFSLLTSSQKTLLLSGYGLSLTLRRFSPFPPSLTFPILVLASLGSWTEMVARRILQQASGGNEYPLADSAGIEFTAGKGIVDCPHAHAEREGCALAIVKKFSVGCTKAHLDLVYRTRHVASQSMWTRFA